MGWNNLVVWDIQAFSGSDRIVLVLQMHSEKDIVGPKQGITMFIGFSKLCHKLCRMK